jgi:hypothetical protein
MSASLAMTTMSAVEFLLSAVLGYLFWRKKLQRRFPAMGAYLALRVASAPVLLAVLSIQSQPWGGKFYVIYFFTFWADYIASAVLLFFISMEVFRSVLSVFPGLMRLGAVVFRWAALASAVVSFSTISWTHRGMLIVVDAAYGLMRSVSILELCLLAFLCLSMNALRLSVRDMSFGIALGFGLMSSNDFIVVSLISRYASLTAPLQFVYESLILVVMGTWVAYCVLPEPVRKPVLMPVNSTIYRWNEIASALGHTGTQVAVRQPATSILLTDVESVVVRVLASNLKDRKSET